MYFICVQVGGLMLSLRAGYRGQGVDDAGMNVEH